MIDSLRKYRANSRIMKIASVQKESLTLSGLFLLTSCLVGFAFYSVKRQQMVAQNLLPQVTSITSKQLLPYLSRIKGNPQAKYVLISFTDYQCPACKEIDKRIDKYLVKNHDQISYAVVNFPLPYHTKAKDMAVYAAMSATRGDFWTTHTRLMQGKEAFNWHGCSKDVKPCKDPTLAMAKAKVNDDIALGDRLPVEGTSTHLLYSRRSGNLYKIQSFAQIDLSIDKSL